MVCAGAGENSFSRPFTPPLPTPPTRLAFAFASQPFLFYFIQFLRAPRNGRTHVRFVVE